MNLTFWMKIVEMLQKTPKLASDVENEPLIVWKSCAYVKWSTRAIEFNQITVKSFLWRLQCLHMAFWQRICVLKVSKWKNATCSEKRHVRFRKRHISINKVQNLEKDFVIDLRTIYFMKITWKTDSTT